MVRPFLTLSAALRAAFFYRSPMPESPKNVFSASLAHPFTRIIPVNMCKPRDKLVFCMGKRVKKVPGTFLAGFAE